MYVALYGNQLCFTYSTILVMGNHLIAESEVICLIPWPEIETFFSL